MITIEFSDPHVRLKALGFLMGRYPGRALKTGEILVPEAALQALATKDISLLVLGKSTYEQQIAAFEILLPRQFNDDAR